MSMGQTITVAELRKLIDCAADESLAVVKVDGVLRDIEGVAVGDRVMILVRESATATIDSMKGLKRTINTATRAESGEGAGKQPKRRRR